MAKTTKKLGEVVRVHETSGSAAGGWSAAIAAAVRGSKDEIPNPVGVEIVRQWADIAGGKLVRYHATVRIAYRQTLRPPKNGK